jgi:hypothetical protein
MSPDQNAGQNHNVKIENKFFERAEQFRYLGTPQRIKIPFRKKLKGG